MYFGASLAPRIEQAASQIQDSMDLFNSLFTVAVFLAAFFRVAVFFLALGAITNPLLVPEFLDLRIHFIPR